MGSAIFQLLTGGLLVVLGLLTAEYPEPSRPAAGWALTAIGVFFVALGVFNLFAEIFGIGTADDDGAPPKPAGPAKSGADADPAEGSGLPPTARVRPAGRPVTGLALILLGAVITAIGAWGFTGDKRNKEPGNKFIRWVFGAVGVAGIAICRHGLIFLTRWFRRPEDIYAPPAPMAPPPGPPDAVRLAEVRKEVASAGGREQYINKQLAEQGVAAPPAADRPFNKAEWKAQRDRARAERLAREAQAAAKRRAAYRERLKTEIPFIGEGVSGGLGRRQSDAAKLTAAGLPVLNTAGELAAFLGIAVPKLRWLTYHRDNDRASHYVYFAIPKRRGGERIICAPKSAMRQAQRTVLEGILSKIPAHEAAHGFVEARSIVTNATAHVGKAVVVNIDLKDFFPTITQRRVKGMFRALGYSEEVATLLSLLCTESPRRKVSIDTVLTRPTGEGSSDAGTRGRADAASGRSEPADTASSVFWVAVGPRQLPQGACTSPAITNVICRRLDAKLTALAQRVGWAYTRYADDLTFSGVDPQRTIVRHILHEARRYVEFEGFAAHPEKVRVQRKRSHQNVTGLVVNTRVGVCRRDRRRFRAVLHNCARHGAATQNRAGRPDFPAYLRGYANFVRMVDPGQGARFVEQVERVLGSGGAPPPRLPTPESPS
jgi:retron-type reverse transcriptase